MLKVELSIEYLMIH